MWTRSLLKTNAKAALVNHYWRAFVVCIISSILAGGSTASYEVTYKYSSGDAPQQIYSSQTTFPVSTAFFIFIVMLIVAILILAIAVLISTAIEAGQSRYFMEARIGNAPISSLFSTFKTPGYWNIVKTMFLRGLYTFLWSLLLVIPGIIKSYQYRLVPYIMAENPNISSRRAFELSRQMTDGEKWNIFVLDLSFIGWYVLCGITFGIGFLFLNPYLQATNAELYSALRAKAFAANFTDDSELGDFVRY